MQTRLLRGGDGTCRRELVAVLFNPSFPYRFAHMLLARR
jgi:cytochrome bd-type quinol oxidase subunit 1